MELFQLNKEDVVKQILKWEQELDSHGVIADEGLLFSYIKSLPESVYPRELSQLLSLAALSLSAKSMKKENVVGWMEKALVLDPENKRANSFLAQNEWKSKAALFETLAFPPIRETDNRAAKRKTAEQYIDICRQFLNSAEDHLDQLEQHKAGSDNDTTDKYDSLIGLLKDGIEQTASLLKAAKEYEQSISGVFHTSVHFEEMKLHLLRLEEIKSSWSSEFNAEENADTTETDPPEDLKKMVGLDQVKDRVNAFYRFLLYQKKRKSLGFQTKDELSLNMILTGNPGTGKTSLARLFAKIYHQLGVLPSKEVIETDRSQLVGAYVGQTEENVRKAVERALGGVLFIDEAYSLKREGQSGNDYGQTAIDTLVSLMTGSEYGGKFAVILAGYPEEMRQFLDANQGLRSRFPNSNQFELPDYTNGQLLSIAEQAALDNDYVLSGDAKLELEKRIEKERVDDTFGNARTVINLVREAIFNKGAKGTEGENFTAYTLLEKEDFASEESRPFDYTGQLGRLVGLENVKEEVTSLASFARMQQLRREKGFPAVPIQLHAVFTGNPGTGKTTVAQIYSGLLKECGMLKRGHLIVGSRSDFVAAYVGQTAIKTKKKIREALGGVLFIDEAYSLLGHSSGDFGKEVIDTLVDEMTKHNENLVVILAGYPKEMENLLESNPGLRSRFKKFFHYLDYSPEELLLIMENYAAGYQYQITPEAKDYLTTMLQVTDTSGNGRFATNVIDEAIQAQAFRLMSEAAAPSLTDDAVFLEKADFQSAFNKVKKGE
ncbi:AAA family ATPase [Bacillus sp. T33-2]|uniref:AAA family ATPase n=1 Tax=Bacillus sp. T33-2 TaxID=2054168 RepID=UPI000C781915|nr:AAA family ATPase [Bacillus sp. T33-2]PLR95255.1 stage V sporulation protein K [Bacillus sp. T33-2]